MSNVLKGIAVIYKFMLLKHKNVLLNLRFVWVTPSLQFSLFKIFRRKFLDNKSAVGLHKSTGNDI